MNASLSLSLRFHPSLHPSSSQPQRSPFPAAAASDNICLILLPSTAEWNQSGGGVTCERIGEHGARHPLPRGLRSLCSERSGRGLTGAAQTSPDFSITSNPPKTRRIKAESITHGSLRSAPLFREITAEGGKQSQDPVLSPEDTGRTLLSSLCLTHNKKQTHSRCRRRSKVGFEE